MERHGGPEHAQSWPAAHHFSHNDWVSVSAKGRTHRVTSGYFDVEQNNGNPATPLIVIIERYPHIIHQASPYKQKESPCQDFSAQRKRDKNTFVFPVSLVTPIYLPFQLIFSIIGNSSSGRTFSTFLSKVKSPLVSSSTSDTCV